MREFTFSVNLVDDYRITNQPFADANPLKMSGPTAAVNFSPLHIKFRTEIGESACSKLFTPTSSPANVDQWLSEQIQRVLLGEHDVAHTDAVHGWMPIEVSINQHGLRVQFANTQTNVRCEYCLRPVNRKNSQPIEISIMNADSTCYYREFFARGQRFITLTEPLNTTDRSERRLTFCAPAGRENATVLITEYRP